MAKWYEKAASNALGVVSGGFAGNKDMGLLDNIAGGVEDYFMGSTRAARAQKNAAKKGMEAQQEMFGQAMDTQQPWLAEGERHLRSLSDEVGRGGFDTDPGQFNFNYEQAPGYQFLMDEGNRGIDRGAAARGNLQSGGNDIDLMRYSQGFAAQDYGNQYNRAYGEFTGDFDRNRARQSDRFNRQYSMTGFGQQAANNIAGMQMQQGRDLSSGYMNVGNAQANSAMAMQNTINPLLNVGSQVVGAFL